MDKDWICTINILMANLSGSLFIFDKEYFCTGSVSFDSALLSRSNHRCIVFSYIYLLLMHVMESKAFLFFYLGRLTRRYRPHRQETHRRLTLILIVSPNHLFILFSIACCIHNHPLFFPQRVVNSYTRS
jgi:hypothetical protein